MEKNKYIINDYKYERNMKLDFYRFVNTHTLKALLKNIAECITDYNVSYIKLVNEFGIIRIKSFDALKEEMDKSQLVLSLELFIKENESNDIKSAIFLDFKEFENLKCYSAIKLYSDDKGWIIRTEEKINKYLEPFKTWKKVFRSPFFTGITTILLATIFIAQIYGGLSSFPNDYQSSDFIVYFGVVFFTIFMVYLSFAPNKNAKKKQ